MIEELARQKFEPKTFVWEPDVWDHLTYILFLLMFDSLFKVAEELSSTYMLINKCQLNLVFDPRDLIGLKPSSIAYKCINLYHCINRICCSPKTQNLCNDRINL